MDTANWEVHSSGIDYVTLTASSPRGIHILKEYADARFAFLERQGFHVKHSAPMGYSGWQVGPVFGGARQDGYMIRVSGQDAQEAFQACWCEYVNITRLDLQLTLRSYPGLPMWAKWSAYQIETLRSTSQQCNWAKPHYHDHFGHGDTLNIGSRQSEKYGRLYDKEMESLDPDYERCWRYEVEYKGSSAQAYAKEMMDAQSISQRAAQVVLGQFAAWCVPLPKVSLDKTDPLTIDKIESDVERKLNWLRKQVAPTVRKIIELGGQAEIDEWVRSCYIDVGQ